MTKTNKSQIDQNLTRAAKILLAAMPGWVVSMVVHLVILVSLAVYTLPTLDAGGAPQLVISSDDQQERLDDLDDEIIEDLNIEVSNGVIAVESDAPSEVVDLSPDDMAVAKVSVELSEISLNHVSRDDLLSQVESYTGDSLSGRGEKARQGMVARGGGTRSSERAVSAALQWLAKHQASDGGWSFDHAKCSSCRGQCRNSGTLDDARAASTGLTLLPFLGAGQTHKTGKYQKTVRSGLLFLKKRLKVDHNGGSFHEPGGNMYSHGIASIALCEAYAMTKDKSLLAPAQSTVNFICHAQDPVGGGWRYNVQSPGDTSVLVWQVMALKSAHMSDLTVPKNTMKKAYAFLDTVQYDGGARYRYMAVESTSDRSPALTALGLLCRMYFGWKKSNPALQRGVRWISERGPTNDIYHNYYATQVMRHWGGELWAKWNSVMRDRLVNSQAKVGHEAGSWYWHRPQSNHELLGGRLYCTAMATMILEVYYRHLPIYTKKGTDDEFPID